MRFSWGEKERGYDELRKAAKQFKGGYAKAGIIGAPAGAAHEGGLTNVELGMIHEFGAPSVGIPERSFVRGPFEAHRADYLAELQKLVKAVYAGKATVRQALGLVALHMSSDMKRSIETSSGGFAPFVANKPETIARKGSSRPLIDTGILKNSISHAVVLPGHGQASGESEAVAS